MTTEIEFKEELKFINDLEFKVNKNGNGFDPKENASVEEVSWAAGFLEGEGCFFLNRVLKKKYPGREYVTPQVTAVQKNLEPLIKLISIFGGNITFHDSGRKDDKKKYFIWQLYGEKSENCMRRIFNYMSQRRKNQIIKASRIIGKGGESN